MTLVLDSILEEAASQVEQALLPQPFVDHHQHPGSSNQPIPHTSTSLQWTMHILCILVGSLLGRSLPRAIPAALEPRSWSELYRTDSLERLGFNPDAADKHYCCIVSWCITCVNSQKNCQMASLPKVMHRFTNVKQSLFTQEIRRASKENESDRSCNTRKINMTFHVFYLNGVSLLAHHLHPSHLLGVQSRCSR